MPETMKHRQKVTPRDQQRLRDAVAPALTADEDEKRWALKIAIVIACNMAINCVDELCDLLKGVLRCKLVMHRTKCTTVITKVIAAYYSAKLREGIAGKPYSLLVDESTDISAKKLVCMAIRFHSDIASKITTTLLEMKEAKEGKAESINDAVQAVLGKNSLSPSDCIGLATDGANAMCGHNNSLWRRLQDDNPSITLAKCACHSLDLVASQAMETMPASLEFRVKETHNYFAHSSTRQAAYRPVYSESSAAQEGAIPLKIISPSGTIDG
ncbi:hypothetical protein HPB48_013168 [Haemaphysalis longicornis]|uniref:DUF4371 domain-containing protein n=1 Tax=Haemaphysalis longicornis TaxID=44386 RepID=A0A9J6G713_HAELO|nr:hypothetical protein HPB48_013168 [Haemaphysalis longicornis]